ncbi:hypothetical protein QQS21_008546 [Conoideocrella luteorostrata]|uniref:Swiss Army Knife RNA repair protein HAD domain-containing protein n=1 Tax=Conoideocrella luteorostrata TaxID=1105319 RepID=A0AAJ0FWF7_9HYPO|nr:hypothetical protein QQS21_008546 [Conoideocrella luteorostrata]
MRQRGLNRPDHRLAAPAFRVHSCFGSWLPEHPCPARGLWATSRGFAVPTTSYSGLSSTRMITPRLRHVKFPSSVMASAYSVYHGASNGSPHTITTLSRWSSLNKTLPAVDSIKALHVYDFDNTLFKTPLPNPALWNGQTIGLLATQEAFSNGGWWHDNRILAATGDGLEKEEPRAWAGWWNEKVVDLARLTIKQPDALCVLLTGRSEKSFSELVKKMVAAKGLEFDIVSLKPQVSPTNQRFQSTMHFKQLFLNSLLETYKQAAEIRVYEDRPKHTAGFREFFEEYNRRQGVTPTRGTISAEVIQVAETSTTLDPITEVAEIQQMINLHNNAVTRQPMHLRQNKLQIKKTVFFTSYMINADDSKKLFKLAQIPKEMLGNDLKIHSNNILICPRPCPANILEKVGGMGSKMLWEVTGTACFENSIWAACVRPVPSTSSFHTANTVPSVVLALKKGARPADAGKINQWQPLAAGQSFVFETTVGEKIILRVEEEDPREDEYESLFAKSSKRKHPGDENRAAKNTHGQYGGRNESRGYHSGSRGGVGGAPRGRGNTARGFRGSARGGGRGGGRSKGPGFHYRSLDDVETKNQQSGGYGSQMTYDDAYPALNQQRPQAPPTGPKASLGRGTSFHSRGRGRGNSRSAGSGQASNNTDLQNYY